ncbi:MAG: serine O-acetyltransferase [Hyphomicrobiales bacterium]|nr:serine O-acetyltransferase [Hyphomicrobiales bacterium]
MTSIRANPERRSRTSTIGPAARYTAKVDARCGARIARHRPGSSTRPAGLSRRRSVSPDPARFDRVWSAVRREAQAIADCEPALASLVSMAVLAHDRLEDAVSFRIAQGLCGEDVCAEAIRDAFADAYADDSSIGVAIRADLEAVCERDPACERFIEPLLYFKGFHALQTHRLAHWLWKRGRRDFALWLQGRASEVFQTDINPAARIGKGIFLDHATGLVIGSTAVVEDDVSILHEVTLGGTGKDTGDRHPKVGRGSMIGAGAKILGNITLGPSTKVGAGSVVLHSTPAHSTVVGVPARVVGKAGTVPPAYTMDQMVA